MADTRLPFERRRFDAGSARSAGLAPEENGRTDSCVKTDGHPCRLAVTGKTSGPSLYHLLQVLGKERVMARIEKALEHAGFNTEVDEKTRLWFSLSLDWLPNLQSFFAEQGITLPEGNFIQAIDQRRENNLVRASQPETENERSKIFHPLSVISTIEKIGKALFD